MKASTRTRMLGLITTLLLLNLWLSVQTPPVRADTVYPTYTLKQTMKYSTSWAFYLDIDEQGNIYVANVIEDYINVFNSTGALIRNITSFDEPLGIAIQGNRMYVTDTGTDNLSVIENNTLIDSTPISDPYDVEVAPNGNIYVASHGDSVVYIYNPNLMLLGTLGSFNYLTGIDIAPDGRILVADTLARNITIFAPDHTLLGYLGQAGSGPGEFSNPWDVEVNVNGYIFVADQGGQDIQIFSPEQQLVGYINGVVYPTGLVADGIGNLFVTDWQHGNITVWETSDLGDHEGPAITNIQATPLNPTANQPIEITATITDLSGVAHANLTYSYPGGTPVTIMMTSNSDTFNATLPGLPANTLVDFYITAEDTSLAHYTVNSSTLQLNILSGPPIIPIDTGTLALTGTALGGLAVVLALVAIQRSPSKRKRK